MSQKTPFLIVGGAIGCSVLLLCACIATIAGYPYLFPPGGTAVDRIALVDNGSNIQIIDAQGEHRVALTTDASPTEPRTYLFPTWSPNSQRVAFVGVSGDSAAHTVALHTAPSAGGKPTTVFQSATQTPFYLYWSPDSQWIGFLAESESEMALLLARGDGQADARKLESGSPLYWAWSPDSRSLLLHVGGSARDSQSARLALVPRDGSGAAQALKQDPANFQAPHYAPDGSATLYAATNGSTDDALFLADAQGNHARSIVTYSGTIAFAWSPDGKKIASLVTPEDAELPYLGPLSVSDAGGGNRQSLSNDEALAFYWSPDSQQIAYLTIVLPSDNSSSRENRNLAAPQPQSQDVQLRWRVVKLADKTIKTVATFVPTSDFLSLLPYFDQYSRSLTFWSPDSRQIVYTQSEGDSGGSVWVAQVAGAAKPRRIGDGTIAVWSWR